MLHDWKNLGIGSLKCKQILLSFSIIFKYFLTNLKINGLTVNTIVSVRDFGHHWLYTRNIIYYNIIWWSLSSYIIIIYY